MEEADYRTTYELEASNWWFVGMRRICLDLVARRSHPDPGGPALDVGCGTGIFAEHLGRSPAGTGAVVGLDSSSTALAFCVERGVAPLVQADGVRLPFADGTFSLVTAIGVVEHIEDDAGAVTEWARVLQPGGRLVLLTSSYRFLWSGHDLSNHHVRRYRRRGVQVLLRQAGLVPERVSYVNAILFAPIAAVRMVERLRSRRGGLVARKDTGTVPEPIDRLLVAVLRVEAWVLRRGRLPFGVSMVAAATRPRR